MRRFARRSACTAATLYFCLTATARGGACPSAVLAPAEPAANAQFGHAVALDGGRALIGAPQHTGAARDSGAAYFFDEIGGAWVQIGEVFAPGGGANARFGEAVAMAGDFAAIGAPGPITGISDPGSVVIYERDGAAWVQQAVLVPDDGVNGDRFGAAIALQPPLLAVGAPLADSSAGNGTGAVYVFEQQPGGRWVQSEKIAPPSGATFDRFGTSVALAGSGLLIGAPDADTAAGANAGSAFVYAFDRTGQRWTFEETLLPPDPEPEQDFSAAVAFDGDVALVGAPLDNDGGSFSGSAYVFRRDGAWSFEAKLKPPDLESFDRVGFSVALQGGIAAVGARNDGSQGFVAGAVHVFVNTGDSWVRTSELLAGNELDRLGSAVAIDGGRILAGAPGAAVQSSGQARLFQGSFDPTCPGGEPPLCPPDCNGNGMPDPCETAAGAAADCNANGVPDECEPDCNGNGQPDDCDVAGGLEDDCDGNLIPDSCEPDCNDNGIVDACDIIGGTSTDCDGNGVPDECEPDCNDNGIVDACDIAAGTSADCNDNGVPDTCDLAAGSAHDCDDNGVLDICEQSDYQLDDGSVETVVGILNGGDLVWLNAFQVQPGLETIRYLSIGWAEFVEPGIAVTLLLYTDPDDDGDPSNATLVGMSAPVASEATNEFTIVAIDPTGVGAAGEWFFVGAVATQPPDQFLATIESLEGDATGSWVATAPAGEINLMDLASNGLPVEPLFEGWGNFLLRADATLPVGVPEACAAAGDVNGDGVTDVNDLILVITRWGPCPQDPIEPCAGDTDASGEVGMNDLMNVMEGWSG